MDLKLELVYGLREALDLVLETQLLSLGLLHGATLRRLLTLAKYVVEALLELGLLVLHHVDLRVLFI